MLKMSAVETLYSDQFKLSKTKLTSPPHTKNNIWQIHHLKKFPVDKFQKAMKRKASNQLTLDKFC